MSSIVSSSSKVSGMPNNAIIVDIPNLSDGDNTVNSPCPYRRHQLTSLLHTPNDPSYRLVDLPTDYLNKLADSWMKEKDLRQINGNRYYLRKLPSGYRMYEKVRPGGPRHVDKFIYGHPRRKVFKSANEFFPHLLYLTENQGSSVGCACKKCSESFSHRESSSASASKPGRKSGSPTKLHKLAASSSNGKNQAYVDLTLVEKTSFERAQKTTADRSRIGHFDEELQPDTVRNLISRLKQQGTLDMPIREDLSIDWIAAEGTKESTIGQPQAHPAWLPRVGELVLFVRQLPPNTQIEYDSINRVFSVFDPKLNQFIGPPTWYGGIVAQVPTEQVTIADLLQDTEKQSSVTYSGFRIEPMPQPTSEDKSVQKRYKYVPMYLIRPFFLYRQILSGMRPSDWDMTIMHALSCMVSVSLVSRFHFKGAWPEAHIYHRGVYLGAELLKPGDTVRLAPVTGKTLVEDFLEIRHIRLRLQPRDDTNQMLCNSMIFFVGSAFTSSAERAARNKQGIVYPLNRPVPSSLAEYDGAFYYLHNPTKYYQVSFNSILNRVYEASAMSLWMPQITVEEDDLLALHKIGVPGIAKGRVYAIGEDSRIPKNKTWLWCDSRLDALGVRSLNGIESYRFDALREEKLDEGQSAAHVLARPTAKNFETMRKMHEKHQVGSHAMGMTMTMTKPAVVDNDGDAGQQEEDDFGNTEHEDAVMLKNISRHQKTSHRIDQPIVESIEEGSAEDSIAQSRKRSARTMEQSSSRIIDIETDEESENEAEDENEDEDELGQAGDLLKSFVAQSKKQKVADESNTMDL